MEVMTNSYQQHSQPSLLNEITQGMELARQLRDNLGSESSEDTKSALLQQILSSYDKALLLLGHPPAPPPTIQLLPHQLAPAQSSPPAVVPNSPISFTAASSVTGDLDVVLKGHHQHPQTDGIVTSKKRKTTGSTVKVEKVRAKSGNGIPDDGFNWRKYGQKDILGARYPRGYYRCTYRGLQNCRATRKVQRSDEDPTLFNITYKGKHTCCNISRQAKSHQPKIVTNNNNNEHQHLPPQNIVCHHYDYTSILPSSFQPGLNVIKTTGDIDINEMMNFQFPPTVHETNFTPSSTADFTPQLSNNDSFYGTPTTSPSPLISPSVSGSAYFSAASASGKQETFEHPLYQQQQQQHFDSDISDIISAAASVTNSPCIEPNLDFFAESWRFNSSFSLDNDSSFFY